VKRVGPWVWLILGACGAAPTPDDEALSRYEAANGLLDEGRYSAAVPEYQYVISHRNGLKGAYTRLAYSYEMLGDESRAVEVLEKLLRVDRDDDYALRHLWRLYVHRGFVDKALDCCRRLQRRYPSDYDLKTEVARLEALKERS
jgi:tetratricopeptide (TPR) repeat protein